MILRGDAADVALGEAQAVLALVHDPERRGRLADLVAAVQDGELGDEDAQSLEELLELGLQSGRIRGVYGPEGEQAALKTYRRLPGGRALADSAADVSEALSALSGKTLDDVKVQSTGPGAYLITLAVDGLELSVRLDRAGARLHSVGV
ncbi:MAG TPA: hypothetical protein VIK66_05550 [Gaiellaceae bacterium]